MNQGISKGPTVPPTSLHADLRELPNRGIPSKDRFRTDKTAADRITTDPVTTGTPTAENARTDHADISKFNKAEQNGASQIE